jgi:anti-sigma B factor antagonist
MTNLVDMHIEQRGEDVVVVRLTGELDISVAEPAGQRIVDALPSSARGMVVDMTTLEFIDSSGVSMLFKIARRVESHRQQLRVVAPAGRAVARVLEIVEFERAAPVDLDVDSAVAQILTQQL